MKMETDWSYATTRQRMLGANRKKEERQDLLLEASKAKHSTRPGADCGSDHALLIAKFRLKLKKVGKTTRPFRYDQYQIPYNYTVEVTNRFKGLDLIDRVPEEL